MTELFKTLLIFVLTLSMILLMVCFFVITVASDALSPGDLLYEFSRYSTDRNRQSDPSKNDLEPAAFPCQLSFLTGAGQLYMPISPREYGDCLERTEQFFEEALGSADNYKPISHSEYIISLLSQGILCVYDYPVPFYMLCHWSGYNYTGENINVSSLFFFLADESVNIHIKDDLGLYHSFYTRADTAFIERTCSSFAPNGVISAITDSSNAAIDVPILSGGITLPCYTVNTNYNIDEGEFSRTAMSLLSINPYLASVYKDGDTTIYIEDNNRLHLYEDGHFTYSVADENGGIPIPSADNTAQSFTLSVLEAVRSIVFPLWEELSSSTVKLSLSYIEENDGTYTVYFEPYISGCYISRKDVSAAAALIKNGKITNLSVYPISLRQQSYTTLLPYVQAQAAASDGAVLRIQYILKDDMSLVPIISDVKEDK